MDFRCFIYALSFVLACWFPINGCNAQEVEHNYLVGPQTTTCDSLKLDIESLDLSIQKIRKTTFRFQQDFKLTRRQGLQRAEFYSCDNVHGFLIVSMDGTETLYSGAAKDQWQQLISSSDPEGYFLNVKNDLIKIEK